MGMAVRSYFFLFFNDTATTEIYTLSLHDALPISAHGDLLPAAAGERSRHTGREERSEEHTSELQSLAYLVCRLLLEKKSAEVRLEQVSVTLPVHARLHVTHLAA